MQIKAAMYGYNRINFMGHQLLEDDSKSLYEFFLSNDIKFETKSDGIRSSIKLEREGKYAGKLEISALRDGHSGIDGAIKIAMVPYIERLTTPQFIVAEFNGDTLVDKLLLSFQFPEILTPENSEFEGFMRKFPAHAKRYGSRVQSDLDIRLSIGYGRSILGL